MPARESRAIGAETLLIRRFLPRLNRRWMYRSADHGGGEPSSPNPSPIDRERGFSLARECALTAPFSRRAGRRVGMTDRFYSTVAWISSTRASSVSLASAPP